MKKEFTFNETVALMHQYSAAGFRMFADFIEEYDMSKSEIVALMREIADNKDAQAVVTKLRDELKKLNP